MAAFELEFSLQQGGFALALHEHIEGRAIALFGPSGSGKTSVLEAVAGLRTPRVGRIVVSGHVLFDSALGIDVPARDRKIGYVPQDILLFPHLSVEQNITYGQREGRRPQLSMLLDLLDLGALIGRRVTSLSGGERQRVALARALFSGPAILLLDEPLAAVDGPRRRRIVDALLRVRDELSTPLIYVTHSPEEARTVSDWAIVIDNGSIVASGPPGDAISVASLT